MIASLQTLWAWLTSTFAGKLVASGFVSMLPLVELRLGIPIAVGLGLTPRVAMTVCILANWVPIVPIILLIRKLFHWLRRIWPPFDRPLKWVENRANRHRDLLEKYAAFGLFVLTAIPLPGTGAWTASLLAALADVRLKHAFPAIALGVVGGGIIMSILSYGVAAIL